jgi:hypothetical protein
MRLFRLCVFALLASTGCGPCGTGVDGGPLPDDAGPPSLVVTINELLAKNDTVLADERGDFDDWVELYNPGDETVDLEGFALSDDSVEPRKHVFESGIEIAPGDFLLIWTDDDGTQGPLHTGFKLSGDGEEVVLTDAEGALVDRVVFGAQLADVSEGRWPDGADRWARLRAPTPEAPNAEPADAGTPLVDGGLALRISEVSPQAGAPAADLALAIVDAPWVELHNPHAGRVELAGYALSTNPNQPQWTVPATMPAIEAGGYALFFLDGTDAPPDHASVVITPGAELALFDRADTRVDLVVVGGVASGRTLGRTTGDELVVTEPTPRAANVAVADAGHDAGASDAGYDAGASDAGYDAGASDAGYDAGLPPDGGDAG